MMFAYDCISYIPGAFLIPFFIMLILCGVPLAYMEMAIGQYTHRGPLGAIGKLCPFFKGAGLATVVISYLFTTYYVIIITWSFYYMFSTFQSELPWTSCDQEWSSAQCWVNSTNATLPRSNDSRSPTEDFYIERVLERTSGIEDQGTIRWQLLLILLGCWVLIYLCIWKGPKSTGKAKRCVSAGGGGRGHFASVEVIVTTIQDHFGDLVKRYLRRKEVLVAVVCFVSFLCGLPNITQGGFWFFTLIDYYAAALSLMILAFFEVIGVTWFYGAGCLARDIRDMTGSGPNIFFVACWYLISPLLIFGIFIFSMIQYRPLSMAGYTYPVWAQVLGWIIALISVVCIPLGMLHAVYTAKGPNLLRVTSASIAP
ncbi:hypothetical protein BaRGS_00025371 [Batillaria attramentaria]|uniref:Uncharacterized protein n=1 Tax=Batillaria attramentaria TaxID=370345 RepID=A0ABD0K8I9_9CAEN